MLDIYIENNGYTLPIIGNPICIQLEEVVRKYELKNIYYFLLPSFHGIHNEDPLNFIREFYFTVQKFH